MKGLWRNGALLNLIFRKNSLGAILPMAWQFSNLCLQNPSEASVRPKGSRWLVSAIPKTPAMGLPHAECPLAGLDNALT